MVVKCPNCAKLFESVKDKLGKKEVCEHCDHVFVLKESAIYQGLQSSDTEKKGKEQQIDTKQSASSESQFKAEPKKKHSNVIPILLGTFFIIVVVIVVIPIVINFVDKRLKRTGAEGILPPTTYELVDGTYKIEAADYTYWEFTCEDGYRLVGSVKVPQYDVNVWLIQGAREFEAYKRGESFYRLSEVSVEQTASHSFNCLLTKGTYYFVVSNTYSLLNSKYPEVKLSLVY